MSTSKEDPAACAKFVDATCNAVGQSSMVCRDAKTAAALLTPVVCAAALRDAPQILAMLDAQRKACSDLADRLCNDLGKETETCKMAATQTARSTPEFCRTRTERYDAVLADLRRMEESNKPLTAEWRERLASPDAPSIGPNNAKITLILFSDFQCAFSAKTATIIGQLKSKYADRIRIVFRQFPLAFHEHARPAAIAALAAQQQGKFWEYYQLLYNNQSSLDAQSLVGYAQRLKLDLRKFKAAEKDAKLAARVDEDVAMGSSLGVQGTPTLYVDGKKVSSAAAFEAVSEAIDKALSSK